MSDDIDPTGLPRGSMFIVDPMDSSTRKIISGFYSLVIRKMRFYHSIKVRLKNNLIAWVGLTLIASIFILSGKEKRLSIDENLLVSLVFFMSTRVIVRLLYLVTQLYHKNLNSVFITALKMENEKIVDSRIVTNMMKSLLPESNSDIYENYKQIVGKPFLFIKKAFSALFGLSYKSRKNGLDPLIYDILIYIVFCGIFWITSGAFFCLFLKKEGMYSIYAWAKYFLPVLSIFACIFVIKKSLDKGYRSIDREN